MTPTNPIAEPNEGKEAAKGEVSRTKIQTSDIESANPAPVLWEYSPRLRKQFLVRCCLFSLAAIALFLDFYRHGLRLETTGAFSSTTLFTLSLLIFFIRVSGSAIRLTKYQFSRKLPKKHLLVLLLFPAAFVAPLFLKIPGFTDGAAHALRKLSISDQLSAAVAEELAKPPDDPDDHWRLKPERETQILTRDPFSKLGLKYAHLSFRKSSLVFEFGSPIAFRWGFSISGEKGNAPTIPPGSSERRSVSKEILVFWGPPD